jgi:hypothetical protein
MVPKVVIRVIQGPAMNKAKGGITIITAIIIRDSFIDTSIIMKIKIMDFQLVVCTDKN